MIVLFPGTRLVVLKLSTAEALIPVPAGAEEPGFADPSGAPPRENNTLPVTAALPLAPCTRAVSTVVPAVFPALAATMVVVAIRGDAMGGTATDTAVDEDEFKKLPVGTKVAVTALLPKARLVPLTTSPAVTVVPDVLPGELTATVPSKVFPTAKDTLPVGTPVEALTVAVRPTVPV